MADTSVPRQDAAIIRSEQAPPDEGFLVADYQQRVNQGFIKPGQPAIYETGGGIFHVGKNEHGMLEVTKQPEAAPQQQPVIDTVAEVLQQPAVQPDLQEVDRSFVDFHYNGPGRNPSLPADTPAIYSFGNGKSYMVSPGADGGLEFRDVTGLDIKDAQIQNNVRPSAPGPAQSQAAPSQAPAGINGVADIAATDIAGMSDSELREHAAGVYDQMLARAGNDPAVLMENNQRMIAGLEMASSIGMGLPGQGAVRDILNSMDNSETFADAVVRNRQALQALKDMTAAPQQEATPTLSEWQRVGNWTDAGAHNVAANGPLGDSVGVGTGSLRDSAWRPTQQLDATATIKTGDTVWGMVKDHFDLQDNAQIAAKVQEVLALNGLDAESAKQLQPGQTLAMDAQQPELGPQTRLAALVS